jgi:hypothetical protein
MTFVEDNGDVLKFGEGICNRDGNPSGSGFVQKRATL